MYFVKDHCAKCLNTDNCEYRGNYVSSLFKLQEFLAANKEDVEWYGTLRATCDYFVKNPETEEWDTCG
jgi:hypothetical protein